MNDEKLPDYNENIPQKTASFVDVNSLYPTELVKKIPTGGLKVFDDDEVEKFNEEWQEIDVDEGDYCYLVKFRYNIPDDVKIATDDLPLFFSKENVDEEMFSDFTKELGKKTDYSFANVKTLIATHNGSEYFTTLGNVQLYHSLGVNIEKILSVYRFRQEYVFRKFINKNIDMRNKSDSEFEKILYKLFSNSIFGKLLFNAEKNATRTILVTSEKKFRKLMTDPMLKDCYSIDEEKVIVKLHQHNIKLNHPQYMGFVVLEEAKRFMFDLYYL